MKYEIEKRYKIVAIKENTDNTMLDKLKEINLNHNIEFIVTDIKRDFLVIIVDEIKYALSIKLVDQLILKEVG